MYRLLLDSAVATQAPERPDLLQDFLVTAQTAAAPGSQSRVERASPGTAAFAAAARRLRTTQASCVAVPPAFGEGCGLCPCTARTWRATGVGPPLPLLCYRPRTASLQELADELFVRDVDLERGASGLPPATDPGARICFPIIEQPSAGAGYQLIAQSAEEHIMESSKFGCAARPLQQST